MPNCTVRSNGQLKVSGGGSLITGGIYEHSTIEIARSVTMIGTVTANSGAIAGPPSPMCRASACRTHCTGRNCASGSN